MRKHILYLASGSSRRFGGNKLLHLLEGKPMYQHGLETVRQTLLDREDCSVTVVSRYDRIREYARSLGFAAVDSPDSDLGIAHTIRAGLAALTPEGEDYFVFLVADQPYLTAASLGRLLDQAGEGILCASLCYGDRPGNPTLFSARLLPELMALEGDTGGRAVLRRYPCRMVQAGSPKELEDIDTRT